MTEDRKMPQDTEIAEDLRKDGTEETAAPSEIDRLAELEADLERARQDILYAQADTQNVRRRMEKEIQDARAYAATGFARDILSIADNLGRALAALPEALRADEKAKGMVSGVEETGTDQERGFRRRGLERGETRG